MSEAGEFDFIAQHLAPLSQGYEGAFGLTDDAAILADVPGLVITTDTMIQGVHFRKLEPWDLVARKALRVNLSDLAAMGADPHAVLLSITWPQAVRPAQMQRFVDGLKTDLEAFGIPLIGGDTTRGGELLVVTVTALGQCEHPLLRSGGEAGQDLYVSGTIGDAVLGLEVDTLAGLTGVHKAIVEDRHLLPTPRLKLGRELCGLASAALDVSDGLVADAGHLARASGVKAGIELDSIPLSSAAETWVRIQRDPIATLVKLITSGDDYELLFSAGPEKREEILAAAKRAGTHIARIGSLIEGKGVEVRTTSGELVRIDQAGFTHF
ncbi:thiamine-phosphate kinase [Hyphobacterium sp. HN65]|uniref:Thiamine-monophosphate kinase n=1 Tax=Hyphobacterium lacteum TaxID=3116575 RepID=A0ABU7LM85_9PROT|nr:thiamine-phosphate kinase [Hyphobacterium sp. HN65]MEE2525019.1 thiamine-phosphate kinase [Hyphobacterium sp. HN65]